jgi:mannose-6-phosphate isomerase-like protein (cupin superfamily)
MRRRGAESSCIGTTTMKLSLSREGRATCIAGDKQREVKAGDIIVIPAGTPHSFINSGDVPLRQIDIHASPKFVTEWLAAK